MSLLMVVLVLLPESVLETVSQRDDLDFPLIFELITKRGIRTHCGVNMFTAPHRTAVLPQRVSLFDFLF